MPFAFNRWLVARVLAAACAVSGLNAAGCESCTFSLGGRPLQRALRIVSSAPPENLRVRVCTELEGSTGPRCQDPGNGRSGLGVIEQPVADTPPPSSCGYAPVVVIVEADNCDPSRVRVAREPAGGPRPPVQIDVPLVCRGKASNVESARLTAMFQRASCGSAD